MKLKLLSVLLLFFISTSLFSQIANPPNDLVICDNLDPNDGFATFDLTVNDAIILGSQDPNDLVISYYETLANAVNDVNAISNASSFDNISNPQTIYARITETSTGNFDTTSFVISVNLLPQINTPSAIEMCDDSNDEIETFDLTSVIPELLNGQSSNDFQVTFYESDGSLISNPISYTNTSNPTSIIVEVVNIVTGCASGTAFNLRVFPIPTPTSPTPLIINDDDCDGFAQFDLESKVPEIGNSMPDVYITFHETQYDADSGTNAIASPYTNYANPQILYVRAENSIGCYAMVTLELEVIDCSSVGQIAVDAFLDTNENSLFDSNENNYTNGYYTYELNNDGITHTVNSSSGEFFLYSESETDSYDITYNLYSDFQNCFSVPIASVENISVSMGNSVTVEFPVISVQSCQDLGIYLLNTFAPPRPGFDYFNRITLKNLGNETITSGTIEFIYDDVLEYNQVTAINSNYTVTPIAGGISIDFINLMPSDIENIDVSLYCPSSISLGTLVTNSVTYITSDMDSVASNNASTFSQIVVGSYDPNDIAESHGPQIVYDDFIDSDEYLYYTIRFQNIGTAEAIDIRIEDMLDSQLDETTFQMLRSSHDYVVTRTANQLVWQFNNINLPSESMDAEASQGYVYFKIKPQAGYAIGDIIPNMAEIYFDFNPAIVTNTFNTEFVETLTVNDYNTPSFSVYPNPVNDMVYIQMNGSFFGAFYVEVFDIQGKQILSQAIVNERIIQLNVSSLESGLYFIKMKNESNETIKKLIIK